MDAVSVGPRWRRTAHRVARQAVSAVTVGAVLIGGSAAVAMPAAATPHRPANPYQDARVYVDPQWSALAGAEPGGAAVADQPTAVWLDRIAAIDGSHGGMGLRDHLDLALEQEADAIQLVLANLPGRGCDRLASPAELGPDELDRYRQEFIDPISEILADPVYTALRIVVIVEPGALPLLITHTSPQPRATPTCDQVLVNGAYVGGIGYAVARLQHPHVYLYLDIGDQTQLGWPDYAAAAAEVYQHAATSAGASPRAVHGVIANTGGYAASHEPFFDVTDVIGGQSVRYTHWVDHNDFIDVVPYLHSFRERLHAVGFRNLGALVDTSRNGWGGPKRPTGPGPAVNIEDYVNASRVDRRASRHNWCNQAGAGLGARPAAAPEPSIDAYIWATPPGVSDGAGGPLVRQSEPMCDPTYSPPIGSYRPTGALPGAPPAGEWFSGHFQELLAHAWPPL